MTYRKQLNLTVFDTASEPDRNLLNLYRKVVKVDLRSRRDDETCLGEIAAELEMVQRNGADDSDDEGSKGAAEEEEDSEEDEEDA